MESTQTYWRRSEQMSLVALRSLLPHCLRNWRERLDHFTCSFSPAPSLHLGLQEGEWLRTWACSLLRSVTGLQVIKDVKNPTIFIWKSSSTRALRVLWPYKGAAGYRGAYIPNCRFVSCWWAWNVVQKAQNLLREEKDRREESGCRRTLCQWSSSSLARGCPFYRRSKYWKACAGIGEKRCQCQKGTKWKPIYDRQ